MSNSRSMREIKFRGLDERGKWVVGHHYSYVRRDNGIREHYILQDLQMLFSDFDYVDPNTIGQFTGLYDKHGKEIYEGDIVRYRDEELSSVNYKWGGFGIEIQPSGSHLWFGNILQEEIKVIGNIHEHPHLLEANQADNTPIAITSSYEDELTMWMNWAKRLARHVQEYKHVLDDIEEIREQHKDDQRMLSFYVPSSKELARKWLELLTAEASSVLDAP